MNKDLADKAAKWWADQLRSPAKLDNGDESETGLYTFALANIIQALGRKSLDNSTIDKFQEELSLLLQDQNDRWFTIGVDYDPDRFLSLACDKAGLVAGNTKFPWKTIMWINDGKITYRLGYHAPVVELL